MIRLEDIHKAMQDLIDAPPPVDSIRCRSVSEFTQYVEKRLNQRVLPVPGPCGSFAGLTILEDPEVPEHRAHVMRGRAVDSEIILDSPEKTPWEK